MPNKSQSAGLIPVQPDQTRGGRGYCCAQGNGAALQPATGMAVATLIVRSVTATIRHNDSEATASEAATAFDSFDDATRTERSPKPNPEIGDRVMVVDP
jgi:hypothetical protein